MTKSGQDKPVEAQPAIGVSINVHLDPGQQRTIVMQTHYPQDTSADGLKIINGFLDLAFEATDRQSDAYRLVEMTREKERVEKVLRFAEEDFMRLEEQTAKQWAGMGKRGPVRFEGANATARDNAMVNIKRCRDEIDYANQQIDKIRKRIGKE